jgi:tetratricopeptide (TPR) repeat protein
MPIFNSLNDQLAISWLERSSDLGDLAAKKVLADIYLDSQQIKQGKALYQSLAEEGDLESIEKIAIINSNQNQTAAAKDWWIKAANLGSGLAMESLGRICSHEQRIDEAIAWLVKATEHEFLFPKNNSFSGNSSTYFKLANLFLRIGDYHSAISWYTKELDSGNDSVNTWIGECYWALNELVKAETFFNAALSSGYGYYWFAQYGLGRIRMAQGHLDEAKQLLGDSVYSGYTVGNIKLAEILIKTNDKSSGYDRAKIGSNEINTDIYSNMSDPNLYHIDDIAYQVEIAVQSLIDLENNLKIKDLEKIPEVVNQITNAISNLGIFYYRFGLLDKAKEKLIEALQRKDNFAEAEASYFLAKIYNKVGESKKADEYQDRCEKSGGYTPGWLNDSNDDENDLNEEEI